MAYLAWTRLILVGAVLGAVACGGGGGGGGGLAEGGAGGEGGAPEEPLTLSIADAQVDEGDAGTTELVFTVSLSRASEDVVRVSYTTDDGTAFAGGTVEEGRYDYNSKSATVRFDPGETEATFAIEVNADEGNEVDETLAVSLSKPSGATIEDGEAQGTIVNDDDLPVVTITDASTAELDSGMSLLQLTIALSTPSGRAVGLDWGTVEGTALADEDFITAMDRVIFAPGETSKIIQAVILGDTLDEPDETFEVELFNHQNAELDDPTGTITIIDNDLPVPVGPSLSIDNATVAEGAVGTKTLTFTITLSEVSPGLVTVDYATVDATAIAAGLAASGGFDYSSASDSVTFLAGETSKLVDIVIHGDTLNEANETFVVELYNETGAIVLDPQGLGTITNDDAVPGISIGNASVMEGAAGTRSATFAVSLSAPSGRSVSVDYATSNGTATAGQDYLAASDTLTFEAGQTSGVVSVTVEGDLLNEVNETFFVDLSSALNATIGDSQAQGTISNDDALPQVSIDDVSIVEGDAGTTNAVFNVVLSEASGQSVSVAWTTANDTATASDYTTGSGNLTFPVGTTTRTISIPILGDVANEPTETFNIDLYSPLNCELADAQGVGTIIADDSSLPALNIEDASVTEGNAGTVTLSLTVTLETASAQTVTVDYTTVDGGAVAATDYVAETGTLTFDPGETSQTVDVTVNGDVLHEPDETLWVTLSDAANAFVADGDGIGTIDNDDSAPTLGITDVTLTEGNAGTKNATFTISLSAASGFPVSFAYATVDGTAVEGGAAGLGQDDYEATSAVLVLDAGETSVQVSVPVNGDTLAEANEAFFLQLSSADNATLADDQGQASITNDDGLPAISIGDVSELEGDAGTKTFTFALTLSSASGTQVSVSFATANGTASSPSDYTATSGTVTFDPGQTTATIDVTVKGETSVEGNKDEAFYVNLSNAVAATILDAQGLGNILNDD